MKSLDSFHSSADKEDGKYPWCKECKNEADKQRIRSKQAEVESMFVNTCVVCEKSPGLSVSSHRFVSKEIYGRTNSQIHKKSQDH